MKLSAGSVRELWEEARVRTGAGVRVGESGRVLELPGRVGRGRVRSFEVREGLEVLVADCELREPLSLEVAPCASRLELNFCLAGGARGRVSGMREEVLYGAGESGLFFGPDAERGFAEYPAGCRISAVEVGISAALVRELLERGAAGPAGLLRVAAGDTEEPYLRRGPTGGDMRLALQGLLDCPFEGAVRRVYLEAKVLELLALHLARPERAEPPALRPDDAERVRAAAKVLAEEMAQPPSLLELSRRVGLNDFKLKTGFKQVLSTTAFGYLHELRMERAWRLLREGEMNVGEVARAVGYAGQSHFSTAFRKRFGVKPGSLSRSSRTRAA